MSKKKYCKECNKEYSSNNVPTYDIIQTYDLCNECIEYWKQQRDKVNPNYCVHGYYKEECNVCIEGYD